MKPTLPAWVAAARGRWLQFAPRERNLISIAIGIVLVFALWSLAIAPAWRTLRTAPAELEALELQLQQMRRLATETRELRAAPPVPATQAGTALKAATDRLGDRAKLALQGERAVLTLQGVNGDQLRAWIGEARSGARARTVEAQLTRSAQGFSGTLVLALGSAT